MQQHPAHRACEALGSLPGVALHILVDEHPRASTMRRTGALRHEPPPH
ncbi:hypothetical protein ACWDY4_24570 [Streptomyces olivaceoviridis]